MADIEIDKVYDGHYLVLRLNRPESLNALTVGMRRDIDAAVADFAADPAMRVAIVTGTGRAFCAGADLRAMAERDKAPVQADIAGARNGSQGPRFPFGACPKPVIAAINGLCVGGGVEAVVDCDIRIACPEAYFGLPEVKRGVIARSAVQHLPRVMPVAEAMNLLLTGDRMSAERAYQLGFVQHLVPAEQLMGRAVDIARTIGANAPLSLQASKSMIQYWRHHGDQELRRAEEIVWQKLSGSDDAKEGVRGLLRETRPALDRAMTFVWRRGQDVSRPIVGDGQDHAV
jgi:enoyl-CoA hydratase/carnithine racemase